MRGQDLILNDIGMRILYFHQHFSTRKGAGGTRSYEFAQRLIRRGHEVTMVCGTNLRAMKTNEHARTGEVRETLVDGIRVIEIVLPYSNYDGLWKRTLIFLRYAFAGIRLALRRDYDLLFATSTPLTAGIPGIAAKLLRRKSFVFEVREGYLIENGALTAPVKNATLIGVGPEALKRVSMVGNNPELDPGLGICGKDGQSVPVGVGLPTLRMDDITVGGTGV